MQASASVIAPENHLDEKESKWFAIYTRYKREKLVAKQLQSKDIEVFLPLQKFTRRWTSKTKVVELPLINCYLFVKIVKKDYVPVLETQDVVQFVKFSKNLISIPEEEINILRRVIGEQMALEIEPGTFNPGDEVEVIGGNLTGLRGKLIEKGSGKNLLIELENLGYTLRMYIDPSLLAHIRRR